MVIQMMMLTAVATFCTSPACIGYDDPFEGEWIVSVSKSKFRGGKFEGRLTVRDGMSRLETIGATGGHAWSRTHEWKYDGRPKHVTCTGNASSTEITEAMTKIDEGTVESLMRTRGHVIARTVYRVSSDGRELVATIVGTNPNGEVVDDTVVFAKQAWHASETPCGEPIRHFDN